MQKIEHMIQPTMLKLALAVNNSSRKKYPPQKYRPATAQEKEKKRLAALARRQEIRKKKAEELRRFRPKLYKFLTSDPFKSWYESEFGEEIGEILGEEPYTIELEIQILCKLYQDRVQRDARVQRREIMAEYLKSGVADNIPSRVLNYMRRQLATPDWADQAKIAEIYRQRDAINQETGVKHHVDHIIPIAGDFVCGLHIESNLRIIPATENREKTNRVDVALMREYGIDYVPYGV